MREGECCRNRTRSRNAFQHAGNELRQEQYDAGEDQRDRAVCGDRESVDSRREREQRADCARGDARPGRAHSTQALFFVTGMQRLGWRAARGFQCRRRRTQHGKQHAEREVRHERDGIDVDARNDAAKITGAQVGAEVRDGKLRDGVTERKAQNCADRADDGRFRQEPARE